MRRWMLLALGTACVACGSVLGVEPLKVEATDAGVVVDAALPVSTAPVDAAPVVVDASDFVEAGVAPTEICEHTNPLFPRAIATDGSQRNPWIQINHLAHPDGTPAQCDDAFYDGTSQALVLQNFGFDVVPANATIQGVIIHTVARGEAAGAVQDEEMKLVSGSNVSEDLKFTAPYPTAYADRFYGSEHSTSGLALTPELVNDPSFGVGFRTMTVPGSGAAFFDLEQVDVTVYYCYAPQ